MKQKTAIVVGAGIIGLATARSLALEGFSVKVCERSSFSIGASVRNFGMVWPIGQPEGKLYERSIRSKAIWQQLSYDGAFWHDPVGSLHVSTNDEEWQVLQEVYASMEKNRLVRLLNHQQTLNLSPLVNPDKLMGSLYSADEMIVDPREVLQQLPIYLKEKFAVEFFWNLTAIEVSTNKVKFSDLSVLEADVVFICSGQDFETLFPHCFDEVAITKCKLQMLRLEIDGKHQRIGPALCGGLSLIHYSSFHHVPSFDKLEEKFNNEFKRYLDLGIHVMVSQNEKGLLTVGDSHEYGVSFGPFNNQETIDLILSYLSTFMNTIDCKIRQSWEGIYAKMTNGDSELFLNPEPGVYILNGVGGSGMTMSFALAEEMTDLI